MEIINVLPNNKIIVKFKDEYGFEKEMHWNNFKRGTALNPYDKALYGAGYLGEGKYKCHENGVLTNHYIVWGNMLCRCYYEKNRHLHSSYEGCEVCNEWLNLQNFAEWYYDNIYDAGDGGRLHIDKDILFKGNKIYSPENCIMVPQRINMIFMTKAKKKDADLPNTIRRCKKGFKSSYNGKALGVFKTLEEAIEAHDSAKRMNIKQAISEYGDKLPNKVLVSLLNW